jgi:hypothetical protein
MIRKRTQPGSRRRCARLAALVPVGMLLASFAVAGPASAASAAPRVVAAREAPSLDAAADVPTPNCTTGPYSQITPNWFGGEVCGYKSLCLDDRAYLQVQGNPVQLYQCNGTGAQDWNTYTITNGQYEIALQYPVGGQGYYCLTVSGTNVVIDLCGDGNQQWIPIEGGELVNPQTGKCLDDTGEATNGHTQLDIWPCSGHANQIWLALAANFN